jgi:hypothetical protein
MDFLSKILPWIGAAATGGVPALIGMAAKTVSEVLGVSIKADAQSISDAVANATPEQVIALRAADNDFKLKAQAMGFNHIEEMARMGLEEDKAYIGDTQDARAKHAQNKSVFWMGVAIMLSFAIMAGMSMWGSYLLLSGGITIKDVGIVAAVFGFLGTVVGYMAANAQQVVGYFYGSSKGSNEKTEAMAKSFQQMGQSISTTREPK